MSALLPEPVVLDPPDEDPDALADLVSSVTGAVFRLGVLQAHLAGPAATAAGWLGHDAAAAAGQVGAVAELVSAAHGALTGARNRLERHTELLAEIRRRIAVLRARQEEDYGAAAARLAAAVEHPVVPWAAPEPPVVVVLGDELRAAEAGRRREHGALLAELRSDALDTARVLADSTAVVGGTGRSGDASRVVAHLAAQLPGWGDGELSARAAHLAAALSGPSALTQMESVADENAAYAGIPAFADALLGLLGPGGVRYLLTTLGLEGLGPAAPLARLLAAALGAASTSGRPADRVREVLDARYVAADDPDGSADSVVLGMGAVLAAGWGRGGGPSPRTVAAWGVQILEREAALGEPAVDRIPGHDGDDPVGLVVRLLDQAGDPGAAAGLLSSPAAWTALLARRWEDRGLGLSRVVDLASGARGGRGAAAARSGLEALGTGLSRAGAEAWPVRPETATTVAPSLGRLTAAHVGSITALLGDSGRGAVLPPAGDRALRGLGYLTADPRAASVLDQALTAWAAAPPASAALAASTIGSFAAVREYGQRLAYALQAAEQRDAAIDREFTFDVVTLPLVAVKGLAGEAVDAGETLIAHWWGADGSWSLQPDRGLVFSRSDATATALARLPSGEQGAAVIVTASAASAFDRTRAALGAPRPPVPEAWADIWLDEGSDGLPEVVRETFHHWAVHKP